MMTRSAAFQTEPPSAVCSGEEKGVPSLFTHYSALSLPTFKSEPQFLFPDMTFSKISGYPSVFSFFFFFKEFFHLRLLIHSLITEMYAN